MFCTLSAVWSHPVLSLCCIEPGLSRDVVLSGRITTVAQGRAVTMSPDTRQVTPRWLKPYTTARVLMLGVVNDVLYGVSSVDSSCLIALLH
jgi:hypothetical protein